MSLDKNFNKILIIDFGSQFTQLIARRIRELGVFSEIRSHKKIRDKDIDDSIKGIILSGGPLNVYEIRKYSFDKKIIEKQVPVLGICFGHQILAKLNLPFTLTSVIKLINNINVYAFHFWNF
mgnify:CR=1 FL=1